MPRLLQINATANWGSTGKIAEQIGLVALDYGWDSYIAYGRHMNPSKSKLIRIGSILDVYEHYIENLLFDCEGLASRKATRVFLKQVDRIKPDIVHLHNIHDHYINYGLLFDYLSKKNIPVVWTQHDCWSYTGGCFHYSVDSCNFWQTECHNCFKRRGLLYDRTNDQFKLRKILFSQIRNLTLVPVSKWLEGELRKSFLRDKKIHAIWNAVDINKFKPTPSSEIRNKYKIGKEKFLLAVASVWSSNKGLNDYVELSKIINDKLKIVLVGLKQYKKLPNNIVAVPRTQRVEELAQLYTEASIVLNLSYQETFGMTTVEGYACGTPSIVYNCTASPELILPETGKIVSAGDINGVYAAICEILSKDKKIYSQHCRKLAITKYNASLCFKEYIKLYESILEKRNI